MNNYQTLSAVARHLQVSEGDLREFERRRWIRSVEKDGNAFLSGRDAYKAKFILHLRRLHLTDDEIGQVLDAQEPPYSLAEIPRLLGRPVALR